MGDYGWNSDGLRGVGPFREPRMSSSVAEELFEYLRAMKHGRELKQVDFIVGDLEDKPYSGPIYVPYWEEGRARKFVCKDAKSKEQHRRCEIHGDVDPWDEFLHEVL